MSEFVCPKCGEPLERGEKTYVCPLGHSYDIAREGYVNLLLANMMNSKAPGDSGDMVRARNRFLSKGYYAPLAAALAETAKRYLPNGGKLIDCGCGEGYYTEILADKVPGIEVTAFDISKPSVRIAAKRGGRAEYAVASVFNIPAGDGAFDAVLNCFSPLALEEYKRVLRKGGAYIYVVPGPRHLWQMKEAIYDSPYENAEEDVSYEGFSHSECIKVRDRIEISEKADIEALFQMTPYYWKTSEKGSEKLLSIEKLETEISFDIYVYERE